MQTYLLLKHIHMSFAFLSIALFVLRGGWMLVDSPRLTTRLVRTLPHVIDTLLLVSALTLAIYLRLDPLRQPWLMAKILALLGYIGFGSLALKPGRPRALKCGALVVALSLVGYIVAVAFSKRVWP
jgi:uncharacterized membrane protein SirB2